MDRSVVFGAQIGGEAEIRDPRVRVKKKDHTKYWAEVQQIYIENSPAAAENICRLALYAEDDRTQDICSGMVMDRAWGKPKDYDPRIEEEGLRCCYHCWLYNTQGQCIDMPCQTEKFRRRMDVWHPPTR